MLKEKNISKNRYRSLAACVWAASLSAIDIHEHVQCMYLHVKNKARRHVVKGRNSL